MEFTSEQVLNMCERGALATVTGHPGGGTAPESVKLGVRVGNGPVGADELYALLTVCKNQTDGEAES